MGCCMSTAEKLPTYNVCLVGDGACGKTSLINTFTFGYFPEGYEPTVYEHYLHDVWLDDIHMTLGLLDTAGQHEFDNIRPLSYEKGDCALICFSVTDRDSFDNVLDKWVKEVRREMPGKQILLCATKCDLRDQVDESDTLNGPFVTHAEGYKMAKKIGAIRYLECSALRNRGVSTVFTEVSRVARGVAGNKLTDSTKFSDGKKTARQNWEIPPTQIPKKEADNHLATPGEKKMALTMPLS